MCDTAGKMWIVNRRKTIKSVQPSTTHRFYCPILGFFSLLRLIPGSSSSVCAHFSTLNEFFFLKKRERESPWLWIRHNISNSPAMPWWRMCWSVCHVLMLCCCSLWFLQTHFCVAITAEMLREIAGSVILLQKLHNPFLLFSIPQKRTENFDLPWPGEEGLKDIKMSLSA